MQPSPGNDRAHGSDHPPANGAPGDAAQAVADWASWMRRCIDLARIAEGQTFPNPMVGAVILRDGEVIAEGWHEGPGKAHAEVMALNRLGGRAEGCTLVVNLEPCCHFGRTPPCSRAVIAAGLRRVVVGMRDPNPIVDGKGIRLLQDAGIEVIEGVEVDSCEALNEAFIAWARGNGSATPAP